MNRRTSGRRSWLRAAGSVALLAGALAMGTAEATLKAVEQAYELHLDQLILPAVVGGNVIVRACARCKPVLLLTSANSRFQLRVDRKAMTLAEFTKAVEAAKRRTKPMVYIYYAPDTRHVNRVVLSQGPGT